MFMNTHAAENIPFLSNAPVLCVGVLMAAPAVSALMVEAHIYED